MGRTIPSIAERSYYGRLPTAALADELRTVYDGFKLDIPGKNGAPGEWTYP